MNGIFDLKFLRRSRTKICFSEVYLKKKKKKKIDENEKKK